MLLIDTQERYRVNFLHAHFTIIPDMREAPSDRTYVGGEKKTGIWQFIYPRVFNARSRVTIHSRSTRVTREIEREGQNFRFRRREVSSRRLAENAGRSVTQTRRGWRS